MHRSAPLAIESTNLSDHPAALAWSRRGGGALSRIETWRRPSRTSPTVYRLVFTNGSPPVYAKRFQATLPSVERTVYEEILPRLPVTAPRYHGSCVDAEGSTWMFLEDIGDQRLSADDPRDRALAARWLGTLHASGATALVSAWLPDAGPARYLAHLRSGRDIMRSHVSNPFLAAADQPLLTGFIDQLDALESRWPRVEAVCAGMPVTLVHGDFRPKNVRMRAGGDGPTLCPFDWEMAGWGIPAADLGGAAGIGPTVPFDPAVYREIVGDAWKDLDDTTLRRAATVGRLFQAVACANWACASLVVQSERHMIRPIMLLRFCRENFDEAVAEGAGWLAS